MDVFNKKNVLLGKEKGLRMKKELLIFVGIFLFLAIGMHFKEWMSMPLEHIAALPKAGAYGLGAFHPLIFTAALYLIIGFFRGIIALVKR